MLYSESSVMTVKFPTYSRSSWSFAPRQTIWAQKRLLYMVLSCMNSTVYACDSVLLFFRFALDKLLFSLLYVASSFTVELMRLMFCIWATDSRFRLCCPDLIPGSYVLYSRYTVLQVWTRNARWQTSTYFIGSANEMNIGRELVCNWFRGASSNVSAFYLSRHSSIFKSNKTLSPVVSTFRDF